MRECAANILTRDKQAVESYEREFLEYLSLCKPLMRVFTSKDEKAYFETLCEFENAQSEAIIQTDSLSVLTMPEEVFGTAASRLGDRSAGIFYYHKIRLAQFEKNILKVPFTEIVTLPEIETVLSGGVKASFTNILAEEFVFYTAEEYARHLDHLLDMIDKYENFNIIISSPVKKGNYMVYVREDFGALVAKTTIPPVVIEIGENNMLAAFWDYMRNLMLDGSSKAQSRKKLEEYLQRLREAIAER